MVYYTRLYYITSMLYYITLYYSLYYTRYTDYYYHTIIIILYYISPYVLYCYPVGVGGVVRGRRAAPPLK